MTKPEPKILHTEKIPIAAIYKQDGDMKIEYAEEHSPYEVYGFLVVLLRDLEEQLNEHIRGGE